jgi:hypothetical protein
MSALGTVSATATPISLAEFTARLDESGCDLTTNDGLAAATALLGGLYANRGFLVDIALDLLTQGCDDQRRNNRYGGQVLLLHRKPGQHFVRANFWPAATDPVLQASGATHYLYDVPHDHNFDFLTVGYLGPGYGSDWFDYDHAAVVGHVGERVDLRPTESGVLGEGQLRLYRAHRDVHRQLPAASLSVSLNIIPENGATVWRDQYLFDLSQDIIASVPSMAPSEAMLRLALLYGAGNGEDIARHIAAHHPSHRMRWTARRALIGAAVDAPARLAELECAALDKSSLVNQSARAMLAAMNAPHPPSQRPAPC